MNEHSGIPTMFEGVQYRSRTEAAFAALFKRWGWPFEYEPADLCRYCPDFVLHFEAGPLLVEVKGPADVIPMAESKIEVSGWTREALILAAPRDGLVGRLLSWEDGEPVWSDAELFWCISCGQVSVLSREGSWQCRVCGVGDGNSHVGVFDPTADWNACKNRVQWRAPEHV